MYATTVLSYPASGQSVPKGRDTSFRDASSKGRIVQGKRLPRDASFRGRIIQRTHCPRDEKSQTERSGIPCLGIHRPFTIKHFTKGDFFSFGKNNQFLCMFLAIRTGWGVDAFSMLKQ